MGRQARKRKKGEPQKPSSTELRAPAPERSDTTGQPSGPIHGRRLITCLAILVLAAVAAYANSLRVPFLFDDFNEIVRQPAIRPPVSVSSLLTSPRGMVSVSLAFNYALGELSVVGYHVLNLLAHIGCGIILFGFARHTVLQPVFRGRYQKHADHLALFAGVVFLVHPIQTESVTYVIQRAEIFVSIALLGGVWIAATGARKAAWWSVLPGLAVIGFLGLRSKESFVVFPVLFALYDWCFIAEGRLGDMARRWPLYCVLGVIGALAIISTSGIGLIREAFAEPLPKALPQVIGVHVPGLGPWQYLTAQFGVLLYYARLILIPDRLCFECGYLAPWPVLRSSLGDMVVVPALVLGAAGAAAWLARKRFPLVTFCVWGSAVVLAPTSSLIPLADVYVEHRLYLPIGFFALLASATLFDLSEAVVRKALLSAKVVRVARLGGAIAVCVVLTWLTIARNEVYSDGVRLWRDTVAKVPENSRAQYNLGIEYKRRGERGKAIEQFRKAISVNPRGSRAYNDLGVTCMELRRYAEAAEAFDRLRRLQPNALAHRNLTRAYWALGEKAKAVAAAEQAVEIAPGNFASRKLLGTLYTQVGRPEEALREFRAAARIRPRDGEVRRQIEALTAQGR